VVESSTVVEGVLVEHNLVVVGDIQFAVQNPLAEMGGNLVGMGDNLVGVGDNLVGVHKPFVVEVGNQVGRCHLD